MQHWDFLPLPCPPPLPSLSSLLAVFLPPVSSVEGPRWGGGGRLTDPNLNSDAFSWVEELI